MTPIEGLKNISRV